MSTYLVAFVISDFRSVTATTSSGVQWFGNLVTMAWWNDIWLNEGFARYMEYISVEATYPDLTVEEYLLHTCFVAVGLDSLNSSRPISSDAENPTQIKEMFDTVSYDKVCFQTHVFSDGHAQKRTLSQENTVTAAARTPKMHFLWHIPLTYKTDASSTIHRHLMTTHTDSIPIEEEVNWVKVNTDMTGYYVVHYEDGGWDEMTTLLRENHTALSYKDRTHLIHNAFQLVTSGHLAINKALELIDYLRLETHTVPLLQGLGYLEAYYRMIEKRNELELTHNLGMYILQFFRAVIDQQTWSDSGSVSERRLRLLELGLEGKVIRSQDLSGLILMVARNPLGHHLAWNFVKKNWDTLVKKLQLGSFCMRHIITGTTGQFSSSEELTDVQSFFESIKEQASQLRATQVALDNVQKNVRWSQRNLEPLRIWLNEQKK
ncbi:hypothetical protein F2P81_013856 [Scophthalmus maximus]|uniref:Uncharacterized protein n=1 Tax=Scophthalmus maximus TaxID=52904 RepID=A0A6A4SPE1_SCOMX|nr:hypothetical protein F2P81_013856 [Scophthalmus maximus]